VRPVPLRLSNTGGLGGDEGCLTSGVKHAMMNGREQAGRSPLRLSAGFEFARTAKPVGRGGGEESPNSAGQCAR
jgi:hypothetical protein